MDIRRTANRSLIIAAVVTVGLRAAATWFSGMFYGVLYGVVAAAIWVLGLVAVVGLSAWLGREVVRAYPPSTAAESFDIREVLRPAIWLAVVCAAMSGLGGSVPTFLAVRLPPTFLSTALGNVVTSGVLVFGGYALGALAGVGSTRESSEAPDLQEHIRGVSNRVNLVFASTAVAAFAVGRQVLWHAGVLSEGMMTTFVVLQTAVIGWLLGYWALKNFDGASAPRALQLRPLLPFGAKFAIAAFVVSLLESAWFYAPPDALVIGLILRTAALSAITAAAGVAFGTAHRLWRAADDEVAPATEASDSEEEEWPIWASVAEGADGLEVSFGIVDVTHGPIEVTVSSDDDSLELIAERPGPAVVLDVHWTADRFELTTPARETSGKSDELSVSTDGAAIDFVVNGEPRATMRSEAGTAVRVTWLDEFVRSRRPTGDPS